MSKSHSKSKHNEYPDRHGFYGLIDEPSVYNRALSQAEIQSIVNAGSAGKRVPAAGERQKTKAP